MTSRRARVHSVGGGGTRKARPRFVRARYRLDEYRQRVQSLTPDELTVGDGGLTVRPDVPGILLLALLDLNAFVIRRTTGGNTPNWWDTAHFPWVRQLEDSWAEIRSELDTYVADTWIPSTAELNGLTGTTQQCSDAVPGSSGVWRILLLQSFGQPVEAIVEHFPKTMNAITGAPAAANVGFSVLDPGAVIASHRDPNSGALRFQLPIRLPEPAGSCRIIVEDEEVTWREGESVMFDLAREHEARNDGDGPRVILMFEVLMPLAFPASVLNRFTQWAYRMLPSYRGIRHRAASLSRSRWPVAGTD